MTWLARTGVFAFGALLAIVTAWALSGVGSSPPIWQVCVGYVLGAVVGSAITYTEVEGKP